MTDIPGGSLTIFGIYLLGLGLNLTPCVYPMISVTVSLFGGQRETHHGRAFLKALVYVLGMATMYSSLGAVAALTNELFGAVLQNPWTLTAIGVLLVLLAMSLFGLYTVQVPSRLLSRLGGKHRASMAGLFVSGLVVGLFAAPCIGPPILALMTFVGTRGDPVFGFWIFFVLSLGLGTPYLVLGTYSSLLHRLPKSGVWLVWMERLFGVVLLCLAAFYFLLAFKPELILWIPIAGLILGGAYLGFMDHAAHYSEGFVLFKKGFGVIAICAGLLIPVLMPRESVLWEPYTPEAAAEAKAAGRPVILDFYADWCIPCHELDQFTYSDPRVREALEGFRRLKVDVTQPDTPASEEVLARYQVSGVPTVLLIDPLGEEVRAYRLVGFFSAEDLLAYLEDPRFQPAPPS